MTFITAAYMASNHHKAHPMNQCYAVKGSNSVWVKAERTDGGEIELTGWALTPNNDVVSVGMYVRPSQPLVPVDGSILTQWRSLKDTKPYVLITMSAPGHMGGSWDGPHREIIRAKSVDEVKAKVDKMSYISIVALFPAEAEIKLYGDEGEDDEQV